jgi:hypothetical protein
MDVGFVARALVLAIEQFFELFLQISGLIVLLRRFEGIHDWSVIFSELIRERRRGIGIVERERVPGRRRYSRLELPRSRIAGSRCSRFPTSSG